VTLLGKRPAFAAPQPFFYAALTPLNIIRHVNRCDCVIFRGGGPLTTLLILIFARKKKLIADLYAFTQFEVPHIEARSFRERWETDVRKIFHMFKFKLYSALCGSYWVANERQKHFLLGLIYGTGHAPDAKDITIIPFGCPSAKPVKARTVLRGVVNGIDPDDFLLIWGGGVWDWLDPVTLVEAMARVTAAEKKVKLYFLGTRAPSGYIPTQAERLIQVARERGVLDTTVFINTGWVPYHERTDYLLEADAGVSLHRHSLETVYAFRTRNLDYVYCGLPMIHTEGDAWADAIQLEALGLVVPPGDPGAVADAILSLYRDAPLRAAMKENVRRHGSVFMWEAIAEEAGRSIERNIAEAKPSLLRVSGVVLSRFLLFGLHTAFAFFKAVIRRTAVVPHLRQ
jgi:glycosyltransferase involved in cell wall biosynthesis